MSTLNNSQQKGVVIALLLCTSSYPISILSYIPFFDGHSVNPASRLCQFDERSYAVPVLVASNLYYGLVNVCAPIAGIIVFYIRIRSTLKRQHELFRKGGKNVTMKKTSKTIAFKQLSCDPKKINPSFSCATLSSRNDVSTTKSEGVKIGTKSKFEKSREMENTLKTSRKNNDENDTDNHLFDDYDHNMIAMKTLKSLTTFTMFTIGLPRALTLVNFGLTIYVAEYRESNKNYAARFFIYNMVVTNNAVNFLVYVKHVKEFRGYVLSKLPFI